MLLRRSCETERQGPACAATCAPRPASPLSRARVTGPSKPERNLGRQTGAGLAPGANAAGTCNTHSGMRDRGKEEEDESDEESSEAEDLKEEMKKENFK